MTAAAARLGLWSRTARAPIPLDTTDVDVELVDLCSQVELRQHYTNRETAVIEAVYTFPLPVDAVLLSLHIRLGGRELAGVVQPRRRARDDYEDAVTDGHTAMLLEQLEEGLYSLSLGNLGPGEHAEIRLRFALLHRFDGDQVRWRLPTVIGPRFGRAPHPDDQVPEAQIDVAHGLHFRMRIRGLLGRARIASPSHAVEVRRHDDHTEVCLSKGGWLDRDVVLTFDLPGGERLGASADADLEEGATVLASFCPQLPIDAPETARGRAITLLVDCSGSMGGVSIAQAKRALQQILATVRPRDRIALVRFGSSIDDVVGAPVSPDSLKMRELHAAVELLDADLGGTELFPALRHALSLAPDEMPADIILITDGQVWDRNGQIASILALAAERGQRIFAVGVGSAVSERQVRALAEGTGGACTMVSPGEQMAPAIQRQFERLFAPRARQVCIDWPAAPSWAQVPQTLF